LTPQQESYLTTLGHSFLVRTAAAKGTPASELYDALMAGWHDNWHTVGTMVAMSRQETNEAVGVLLADGYLQIDTPSTTVKLLPKGAVWYIKQIWGLAWCPQ